MKQAQIFSMIAVLMSVLFILLFSGITHVALDRHVPAVQSDVLRMDTFILDLSYFMDTITDKVTYDILRFTVDYLNTTSAYPNYTQVFVSCFTFSIFSDGGVPTQCSWSGTNISFPYQLAPVLGNASTIYDLTVIGGPVEVTFRQFDAYVLEINVSTTFFLEKLNMRWQVPLTRTRHVSFIGITDPATKGTAFERAIYPAPGVGDLFRAGVIAGNVTTLTTFMNNGYYYRDITGLSFVDLLEGRNLTNTSANNYFGINALVPLYNSTGDSLYRNNQTSMVLYHYTSGLTFTQPENLVRFSDVTGINSSLIFHKLYILNTLQFNDTSLLLAVENCCDATGCDPFCG